MTNLTGETEISFVYVDSVGDRHRISELEHLRSQAPIDPHTGEKLTINSIEVGEYPEGYIPTPYEDLLRRIITTGVDGPDRTGTGTRSIFGAQMVFDLAKGFPLITTKKVFLRGVIEELLWLLKGDSNIAYLRERNVKIWDAWADEKGDIGPMYPTAWRQWRHASDTMVQVDVRSDAYSEYSPQAPVMRAPIECDLNSDQAWAVEHIKGSKNSRYLIQLASGYTMVITRPNWRALIARGSFEKVDRYRRSVAGTGYLGDPNSHSTPTHFQLWQNMIARCYNPLHPSYRFYGGRGVTVSPVWHSFAEFTKTLHQVPGYIEWQRNPGEYQLDKDYYGSSVYSPSTTAFLGTSENGEVSTDGTCVEIQGRAYTSFSAWERASGLRQDVAKKAWSANKAYKGIAPDDVKILNPNVGKVWRREIFHDQIANAIQLIKSDPDSRRIIVSAWNPGELDQMALAPCHAFFQFYVKDGKLSCKLTQRSADMFLGVPFNIASYSLLTMMIAQQTGLELGEFIWSGGDCHIYANHFDQVVSQLSRDPRPLPQMEITPAADIDSYTIDNFKLVGYDPHPPIKAQVSV